MSSLKSRSQPIITVGDPKVIDVSLMGVSFQINASIVSPQSGKVDFLSFHDFRVNDVLVTVEEYTHPFAFRKNETIALPRPATILLPTTGILHAAWKEMIDSRDEWSVTGRVLVFGKFRKHGFYHKRVVPVDVSIRIANPLT